MTSKLTINVPMNRVEGDLEVRVAIEDGRVTDSWCAGTLFRGFERILVGRGALDGLVITPRICGICTTSHLTAAAKALDAVAGASVPPDALRMRNVTLAAEHVQSDVRQSFLMYSADFTNRAFSDQPLFEEAVRRYEPLKGETAVEVLKETKKVLEIVAIVGGQWPHSSFMVPGGIASAPSHHDILQCRLVLSAYRRWYEQRILGCSTERWREVRSLSDLDAWLDESDAHRQSDLGFFLRFARALGLGDMGHRESSFLSYGSLELPEGTAVDSPDGGKNLIPAAFLDGGQATSFDEDKVAEHVAASWFAPYDGGLHPSKGRTEPYATGDEGRRYSWAKAPRYDDRPAETGPLAEMLASGDALFVDLVKRTGASSLARQLARVVRPAILLPAMQTWLEEATGDGVFYESPGVIEEGEGVGLTHAGRGALGHWVRIEGGKIAHYQVITPTAWNASPRDSAGKRGPMEDALVGTKVRDVENPAELGLVVRSFDPCLVCTVHSLGGGRRIAKVTLGAAG